jgi:hypothetical protein
MQMKLHKVLITERNMMQLPRNSWPNGKRRLKSAGNNEETTLNSGLQEQKVHVPR